MNMIIEITINESPKLLALLERLRDLPRVALRAVAKGMEVASLEVIGNAVRYRFSGKGPFPVELNRLGVVTRRLSRSLRASAPQVKEGESRVVQGYGAHVSYWAGHEFGFSGPVNVKSHRRVQKWDNFKGGKRTGALLKQEVTQVVRGHRRNVVIKARAPLGTELKDARTVQAYRRAIARQMRAELNLEGERSA